MRMQTNPRLRSDNNIIINVIIFLLSIIIVAHLAYNLRYHQTGFNQLELNNEISYSVANISFDREENSEKFVDVSFDLTNQSNSWFVQLKHIDLSLFLPLPPQSALQDTLLTSWFVNEREYNRQRVTFNYDSPHLIVSSSDKQKIPKLSIDLTNNCLGAGYWELSANQFLENGSKIPIYQGFFKFPKGDYKHLFEKYTKSPYWLQAPNIEAWFALPLFDRPPFWNFTLNGKKFPIEKLRTIIDERKDIAFTDLESEQRISKGEQKVKENKFIISPSLRQLKTWEALRNNDNINFVRFTTPGIYKDKSFLAPPVKANFGEIATLKTVILRDIDSPLANNTLQELELNFLSKEGKASKLIISGFDFQKIPQLPINDYDRGLALPLGYGPSFTEDYEQLKQNPPHQNPFFSVMLDKNNRIIDYRYDVGLNGLILHRDADNPRLLHVYLMSYERILLVGHYQVLI